jgi:DNA-binding response OmpR family regulator
MYALLLAQDLDEKAILNLVLQRAGLAVTFSSDLERAMTTWPERPADMIVVALPGTDPMVAVRRIRRETSVPTVVIAQPVGENAHYQLLEAGADRVVQRPFSAKLLVAQIRALLRRAGSVPLFSLPTLSIAGLSLDPSTRTVQVQDHPPKRLTHLEFRLLYTLMIHGGHVLSTETIVEQVWGYDGRGDKELVRGLVRRLRQKIEPEPHQPRYILTVSGVGYSFASDGDEPNV